MRTLRLLPILLFVTKIAAAQEFAEPPGGPLVPAEPPPDAPLVEAPREPPPDSSRVRVSVGPALRIAESTADGGLAAALDFGSGPAGARLSGTWVRFGSDDGLSEYRAEIFVDFDSEGRLHPILGAGAGVARLSRPGPDGTPDLMTYGVGVLRGTLEYALPVERTDARVGLDATGSVPAIQGKSSQSMPPWLVFSARVGVGF